MLRYRLGPIAAAHYGHAAMTRPPKPEPPPPHGPPRPPAPPPGPISPQPGCFRPTEVAATTRQLGYVGVRKRLTVYAAARPAV